MTLRSEFDLVNYENAAFQRYPYGTYTVPTVVPQVYLTYQFHTLETSADRHAIEKVYYPSVITQEYYLLARVRVIRPRRFRADRRLRVVEVVVVDVEAVIQRTRLRG